MTLNEVEQAIRNLITNQPMVTSGPSGDVVNNLLSIINSYKNFRFLVQNHPAQDSFKFNALNISQRTETELANAVCQTLQERGINLMMYMNANQYGMMQTNYSSFAGGVQPQMPNMNGGMVGGQVVYNNPQMMQQPMGQMGSVGQNFAPNGMQYNAAPMGQYPQQPPQGGFRPGMPPRPGMPNGQMGQVNRMGQPLYPRTAAPTQPISFGELDESQKAIKPHKKPGFQMPKPVAQPTKVAVQQQTAKPANEPKVQHNAEPKKLKPDTEKKHVEPPKPVEPEVVEEPPVVEEKSDMVKATGRNYLLELLKK